VCDVVSQTITHISRADTPRIVLLLLLPAGEERGGARPIVTLCGCSSLLQLHVVHHTTLQVDKRQVSAAYADMICGRPLKLLCSMFAV